MVKFRRGRRWGGHSNNKKSYGGGDGSGGGNHHHADPHADELDGPWVDSVPSNGPYPNDVLWRIYGVHRVCSIPERRHPNEACARNALCLKGIRTQKGGPAALSSLVKATIGEAPVEAPTATTTADSPLLHLKGLRNLGNTCYLNAVLQSLFFNHRVRRAVFQAAVDEEQHASGRGGRKSTATVAEDAGGAQPSEQQEEENITLWSSGLPMLFAEMELCNTSVVSPERLITALAISKGVQQDAQEFFGLLISWLMGLNNPQLRSSIQSEFQGTLLHTRNCQHCGAVAKKSEDFSFLSLPMPCGSIENGLCSFLAEETEINDFRCEKCLGVGAATSRVTLRRAPQTLALHLLRFQYDVKSNSRIKLGQSVTIPHHINLSKFTGNDAHETYFLRAVINHIGTKPVSGHYVAHVSNPANNKWFSCNDNEVKPLEKISTAKEAAAIESTEAYLILYSIDIPPPSAGTSVVPQPPVITTTTATTATAEEGGADRAADDVHCMDAVREAEDTAGTVEPPLVVMTPLRIRQRLEEENRLRAEQHSRWASQRDALRDRFNAWSNAADAAFAEVTLARDALCASKDRSPMFAVPLRWLKYFGSGKINNPLAEYSTSGESSGGGGDDEQHSAGEWEELPAELEDGGAAPQKDGGENDDAGKDNIPANDGGEDASAVAATAVAEGANNSGGGSASVKRKRSSDPAKPRRRTVHVPQAVPTLSLLCPHKRGVDVNASFKLVPSAGWDAIVGTFGAEVPFDTSPESPIFCNECAEARVRALQTKRCATQERERMLEIAKTTNYDGPGVFVNSSIINAWCTLPPVEHFQQAAAPAAAEDEAGVEPPPLRDLSDGLQCAHGCLSTTAPRRAVPCVLVEYLTAFGYHLSVAFPCDTTKPCEMCISEGETRAIDVQRRRARVLHESKLLDGCRCDPQNFNRSVMNRDIANYAKRHKVEWQKQMKQAAATTAANSATAMMSSSDDTTAAPPVSSSTATAAAAADPEKATPDAAPPPAPVCPPRRQDWFLVDADWVKQWAQWISCKDVDASTHLVPHAIDNKKFLCAEHGGVLVSVEDLHPSKCPAHLRKQTSGPVLVAITPPQYEYIREVYGCPVTLKLVELDSQHVLEPPCCTDCRSRLRDDEERARRFFSNVTLPCSGRIRMSKKKLVTIELLLQNISYDSLVDDVRDQISAQILDIQKVFISSKDFEVFDGKLQLLSGTRLQDSKVTADSALTFQLHRENEVVAAVRDGPTTTAEGSSKASSTNRRNEKTPKKPVDEVGFAGSRLHGVDARGEVDPEAHIECGVCTFYNSVTATVCEMCGGPLDMD